MVKTMKWTEIVSNAKKYKKYVDENQKETSIKGYSKGEVLAIFGMSVTNIGKDITITKKYNNCPSCTGNNIYQNLTKTQYLDVANRSLKWLNEKGNAPNYITFKNNRISVRLAIYCFSKIILYYSEHKQLPNTCWFANAVFNTKQSTKTGFTAKLEKATGVKITDYKSLYKAMYQFRYDYYYEDKQTNSETLARMKGNCVDLNQVEYYSLKELYPVDKIQIVRGVVQCSDGRYGHVWCRIKVGGSWVNLDASASARGKPIGSVICSSVVSVTNVNPAWAVNDTGA